jgi:hypothetical protein
LTGLGVEVFHLLYLRVVAAKKSDSIPSCQLLKLKLVIGNFAGQNKRTFVGRKLETTSLRLDTGALAARFLAILSAGEPFEPTGRSRSIGVEAIVAIKSQRG